MFHPQLIALTRIWHAMKNMGTEDAGFVTMNDRVFCYEDPDDWRLPLGDGRLPNRAYEGKRKYGLSELGR